MTEFRAILWVVKPGSLTHSVGVVDYRGVVHYSEACFIPQDLGTRNRARRGRRAALMGKAGWFILPAKDWPSILPEQGVFCVGPFPGRRP